MQIPIHSIKDPQGQDNLDLKRGTVVRALQNLDPEGSNVHTGDIGVVFEETNYHGDLCGPLVRWLRVSWREGMINVFDANRELRRGGVCNVYPGWVEVVD